MFVFELPEVGEGVVEGEIVKWLVSEGEMVSSDQPICEIMTDKATIEISSPKSGKVHRLHGSEGDVIEVHTPLIELDDSNGAGAALAPEKAEQPIAKAAQPPAPKSSAPKAPAPRKPAPIPAPAPRPSGGKVLASPAVRAYANQIGVELGSIAGTGKGSRITRQDIDKAASRDTQRPPHSQEIKAPPALRAQAPAPGEDKVVRIIGLRRKIAEKMVESVQRAPHFTYVDEVDATDLVALRTSLKADAEARGTKLTYLPFIMKALVSAFREFPTVNSIMDEESFSMVVRGEVNIGIATDTPAGLYVPVVRNVEQKSILELAAEVNDLTRRTREGKVQLSELQGGTFTITSVGNIGGRFATPIINHPEVAILGVNQIHDRPVVRNGEIVARKMLYLSPSFDHRVIDGAVAARFIAALKRILENPTSLILELR
jgi:pyruvate dehydrogenase E2 component (dihydrolipoamide acetyltransferase)